MKLEDIVKIRKNFQDQPDEKPVQQDPMDPKLDMADYPWEECIADQMARYGDEETAKKVCGAIKAGMKKSFAEGDSLENACWPGWEAIGLKEKDGRMVPNCVPIKQSKEDFVIPTPESNEEQDKYISRCISAIIDEYGQEQAAAICYGQWDKK